MPDAENTSAVDFESETGKLRKHFGFTAADLSANQSGVLSDKQKQRFEKEEQGGKRLGFIIGGLMLVLSISLSPALSVFAPGNLDFIKDVPAVWLLVEGFGVVCALILLALAGAGVFMIISQFMGKKKTLLSVRGKARLEKGIARGGNRRSSAYHDLYIDDQEFDGDGTIDKAIIRGAEYIVYYMDGINEIMSVELVRDIGSQE